MLKYILFIFCLLPFSFFAQLKWNTHIDSCNFFSSPNVCDLNDDGILDIVIGGGIEYQKTRSGILAFNGKNGEILWQITTRSQIYTSPLFLDITKDGIPEVFIGGRDALYYCVNGKTGETIWEFWNDTLTNPYSKGWYNFYGCMFTHDIDNDNYPDLLVTNGGDHLAPPSKKKRPTAFIMVISSKTGRILVKQPLSENKESYYAPHTFNHNGKEYLIYGSGGETIGGSLRSIPFEEFVSKGLSNSTILCQDTVKGYILNSLVTELNHDTIPDLININMNGRIQAVSLKGNELWQHHFEGYENYVTPALGDYNSDNIPDVFTIFALGRFPAYSSFKPVIFDGYTGEILYEAEEGFNQFSPGVAADLNNDKKDDFIYIENNVDFESNAMTWRLKMINSDNQKTTYLSVPYPGCSMASSPLIVDLNQDGVYEIIVAITSIDMVNEQSPKSMIYVFELPKLNQLSWDKYLGPASNGLYFKNAQKK